MKLINQLRLSCILLVFAGQLVAEDFTIANVRLFEGPGKISRPMAIRVTDGKIVAFDYKIDAAGSHLYAGEGGFIVPGYIDSGSTVGLQEVRSASTRTQDHAYQGDALGAAFNPTLAFNNRSTALVPNLNEGITHVMLKPGSGRDCESVR